MSNNTQGVFLSFFICGGLYSGILFRESSTIYWNNKDDENRRNLIIYGVVFLAYVTLLSYFIFLKGVAHVLSIYDLYTITIVIVPFTILFLFNRSYIRYFLPIGLKCFPYMVLVFVLIHEGKQGLSLAAILVINVLSILRVQQTYSIWKKESSTPAKVVYVTESMILFSWLLVSLVYINI